MVTVRHCLYSGVQCPYLEEGSNSKGDHLCQDLPPRLHVVSIQEVLAVAAAVGVKASHVGLRLGCGAKLTCLLHLGWARWAQVRSQPGRAPSAGQRVVSLRPQGSASPSSSLARERLPARGAERPDVITNLDLARVCRVADLGRPPWGLGARDSSGGRVLSSKEQKQVGPCPWSL